MTVDEFECQILNFRTFSKSLLFSNVSRFTGEVIEGESKDGEKEPTGLSLVAATMKHMKKHSQQLLIPLTVWSGLEQGFFGADYTAVSHFQCN